MKMLSRKLAIQAPFASLRSHRWDAAFTLLELLIVIGLILLITAMATPKIGDLQNSFQLTRASSLIKDQLNLARQLAMTQNRPVSVSFCKIENLSGEEETFHLLQIEATLPDGTQQALAKPVSLPDGIIISSDATWSSLMNLKKEFTSFRTQTNLECRKIAYRPSGRTNLSQKYFFTLYPSHQSTAPEKNFVTLVIDPMTGRISTFQP